MDDRQKGFTLIELLVVVAIIGILSGIAFVSISGARESAYDTQIQSELSQIRSSAEQWYYDEGGTYGGGSAGSEYNAYDEDSESWEKVKGKIPPCSVALQSDAENPDEYQIDVGNQAYLAWAPLCAETEEDSEEVTYYCIDSDGNAGEYEGTPKNSANGDEERNCEEWFSSN